MFYFSGTLPHFQSLTAAKIPTTATIAATTTAINTTATTTATTWGAKNINLSGASTSPMSWTPSEISLRRKHSQMSLFSVKVRYKTRGSFINCQLSRLSAARKGSVRGSYGKDPLKLEACKSFYSLQFSCYYKIKEHLDFQLSLFIIPSHFYRLFYAVTKCHNQF